MFDLSWSEIGLIAVVAIVVIGPDELPTVMRTLGRVMRRLQYVRYAFTQQFEDFMREADIDDLRRSVNFEAKDREDFNEAESDEDHHAPLQIEKKESGDEE